MNSKSTPTNQDSLIEIFENPFHDDELVIHVDYGVGIYKGLELLKTNSSEEEYIRIEYLENEILYVPIRQAYLVSKFQVSQTNGTHIVKNFNKILKKPTNDTFHIYAFKE